MYDKDVGYLFRITIEEYLFQKNEARRKEIEKEKENARYK
jgi:hypothetical protein